MIPLHMGALHPFEQALTVALAFGPFLVLGLVIWRRRRQEETPDPAGGVSDEAAAPQARESQRER